MVEKNNLNNEEESEEAFIIPEFGPCGGGDSDDEISESSNSKANTGCGKIDCCKEE
jgi:hypothetical protein